MKVVLFFSLESGKTFFGAIKIAVFCQLASRFAANVQKHYFLLLSCGQINKVRAHLYGDPTPVTLKTGLRFFIVLREVIVTPCLRRQNFYLWRLWQKSPMGPFPLSNFGFRDQKTMQHGGGCHTKVILVF